MMLDVARDATREDVETAFLSLAKRWHPDRLPPELAPVRDACSRVFGRMSEAHTTLGDEEQRARYMKLVSEGSGSPEMQDAVAKVVEAAQNFQKAEIYFKRNDLAQAEVYCRRAHESDPTQPDYLAMLAWLIASKAENQSAREDDGEHQDARQGGLHGRRPMREGLLLARDALQANRQGRPRDEGFRRVVDVNPRNIDAAREVRLHNMRGGRNSAPPPARTSSPPAKPEDAQKGGLLGRLFKKP